MLRARFSPANHVGCSEGIRSLVGPRNAVFNSPETSYSAFRSQPWRRRRRRLQPLLFLRRRRRGGHALSPARVLHRCVGYVILRGGGFWYLRFAYSRAAPYVVPWAKQGNIGLFAQGVWVFIPSVYPENHVQSRVFWPSQISNAAKA